MCGFHAIFSTTLFVSPLLLSEPGAPSIEWRRAKSCKSSGKKSLSMSSRLILLSAEIYSPAMRLTRIEEVHNGHECGIGDGEDDVCCPIDAIDQHRCNHDNEKVLFKRSATTNCFNVGLHLPRANERTPRLKFLVSWLRGVKSLVRTPMARR
ncbi:hypothetical protein BST61_g388 [Cercospora zeina]